MTPEELVEKILVRLDHEGTTAFMFDEQKTRPIVAEVIRQARAEALEEAAKIAEQSAATAHDEPAHYGANDASQATAENIAAAIREMAKA